VAPLSKRVAVISDVHGNRHALDAVLAAIAAEQPDELWCLGDLVGYGPQPNECCRTVAAHADLCLAGNHDLVVLGSLSIHDFAGDAATAARWTQGVLADDAREFLAGLQSSAQRDGAELFHGSARDPVWEYVLDSEAAWWTLQATSEPLVLVGHSHVPLAIELEDEELGGGLAREGTLVDLDTGRRLLNPGSVGQPRDGDPRAAYLLLEPGRRAAFHRVEYPVERTQAEMREQGLPEALAARLKEGL
jgi:diadenosine tetraphosphatase ApaH/serine/threonine PP2A family protein phosphatase